MDIEKSYIGISTFFGIWVRLMEIHTRLMQIQDLKINGLTILIISPPTDIGIKILTQENIEGQSYLLCFSSSIERVAKKYLDKNNITNLNICVSEFFHIPFCDAYFDAVFANCFFDFCDESYLDKIVFEVWRVLKDKGSFFSVHKGFPTSFISRLWSIIFGKMPFLSQGCHCVDIKDALVQNNFYLIRDVHLRRLGFPLEYIQAEKANSVR
jgi:SAM-dependent methyltransferase